MNMALLLPVVGFAAIVWATGQALLRGSFGFRGLPDIKRADQPAGFWACVAGAALVAILLAVRGLHQMGA